MIRIAAIAAAVLIAGSLAAQEPATGSAEPEAALATVEGTTSNARQIVEVRMPPRDVWRDNWLVILGGAITGLVGLVVGLFLAWWRFLQERKEKKRTIAAVLVAELNHILALINTSLETIAGVAVGDIKNDDQFAVIENLRRIQRFDSAFKAVLPQIGVLGAENANRIINLYFGLELLVEEAHSVEDVRGGMTLTQVLPCLEHANEVREDTDKLGQSLFRQFLIREQITEEIEAARVAF